VAAHVAEYTALRAEIGWLIKNGAQYQGLAIALSAAAVPLLEFLHQGHGVLLLPALTVLPLPFALLGLYTSVSMRSYSWWPLISPIPCAREYER
jgi:hypothetical protein